MNPIKTRVLGICCLLVLAVSFSTQATPGQPGTLDTTWGGTGLVATSVADLAAKTNGHRLRRRRPADPPIMGGMNRAVLYALLAAALFAAARSSSKAVFLISWGKFPAACGVDFGDE